MPPRYRTANTNASCPLHGVHHRQAKCGMPRAHPGTGCPLKADRSPTTARKGGVTETPKRVIAEDPVPAASSRKDFSWTFTADEASWRDQCVAIAIGHTPAASTVAGVTISQFPECVTGTVIHKIHVAYEPGLLPAGYHFRAAAVMAIAPPSTNPTCAKIREVGGNSVHWDGAVLYSFDATGPPYKVAAGTTACLVLKTEGSTTTSTVSNRLRVLIDYTPPGGAAAGAPLPTL